MSESLESYSDGNFSTPENLDAAHSVDDVLLPRSEEIFCEPLPVRCSRVQGV